MGEEMRQRFAAVNCKILRMKPQFIHIGNRILNLSSVQFIEIIGPNLLNVHLMPNQELIQYEDEEARALLGVLRTGYMAHVLSQGELEGAASSAQ